MLHRNWDQAGICAMNFIGAFQNWDETLAQAGDSKIPPSCGTFLWILLRDSYKTVLSVPSCFHVCSKTTWYCDIMCCKELHDLYIEHTGVVYVQTSESRQLPVWKLGGILEPAKSIFSADLYRSRPCPFPCSSVTGPSRARSPYLQSSNTSSTGPDSALRCVCVCTVSGRIQKNFLAP